MPEKELIRLTAVNRFLSLNIDKKEELQGIVELAATLYSVPFAIISLLDHEQLIVNRTAHKKIKPLFAEHPLYKHLLDQRKTLIANHTDLDKPLIRAGKQNLKFYVSVPLITHDGHYVGSLLLMDYDIRQLKKDQKNILETLARRIVQLLELDFSLDIVKEQFLQAKDAEIKLRSFFESTGACHLLIGKHQEILAFNKNMFDFIKRMHHVTLYPGITVDKILREMYLKDFVKDYNKALSGKAVKYERRVDYNGTVIWWHVTFEPGYNAEGEIIGISYNATDITGRKNQEQKILDQNTSLKAIAHMQSHELRKPVACILAFMELFKSESYITSKEDLQMMEKAVHELDTKIREIVNMTSNEE